MTYLVIRARSDRGVTKKIRDTMTMLNLTRVNHAVLVPKTDSYDGMLQKVKDYVTWGEVDADTISTLIKERGRMSGNHEVTDSVVKSASNANSCSLRSLSKLTNSKLVLGIVIGKTNLQDCRATREDARPHRDSTTD